MNNGQLLPETAYWNGTWEAPPGKAKGCLPKRHEPGEVCGFWRDIPDARVIPISEWDDYLDKGIDLQMSSAYMYSQASVGSCAAEGVNAGVEVMQGVSGMPQTLFNPYGMYHYTSGGRDNGSTLSDNLSFARDRGCFPEVYWPRTEGWRKEPNEDAQDAALQHRIDEYWEIENWEEMGSALLQRFAVYAAYAGHAWLAVAVVNKQQLKYRNSWGEDWGDHGYGIINQSRVQFQYGIYAIRTTLWLPDSAKET